MAYALRSRGIGPGDKVLVCCPNVPSVSTFRSRIQHRADCELLEIRLISDALQGIAAVQAVIVPINTRLTEAEVSYLITNSDAKLILVDSEFAHLVASAKVPIVISSDGKPGCAYEKFLEEGAAFDRATGDLEWAGLEFQKDELATFAICYTSGTTSQPKGVETSCQYCSSRRRSCLLIFSCWRS